MLKFLFHINVRSLFIICCSLANCYTSQQFDFVTSENCFQGCVNTSKESDYNSLCFENVVSNRNPNIHLAAQIRVRMGNGCLIDAEFLKDCIKNGAPLTSITLDKEQAQFNDQEYVFYQLKENFDQLNISVKYICRESELYKFMYILHKYFDSITWQHDINKILKDKDLAVYFCKDNELYPKVGIYHSGMIQSKWHWQDNVAHKHAPFFVPKNFGDEIKFYRIKNELNEKLSWTPLYKNLISEVNWHLDNHMLIPNDDKTVTMRKIIDQTQEHNLHNIEGIYSTHKTYIGICHNYAHDVLKFINPTISCDFSIYITDPEMKAYFTQENVPKKGDLVRYYKDAYDINTLHSAIYIDNGYVESKWGLEGVFFHHLFRVGVKYGNYVKFWRLIIHNNIKSTNTNEQSLNSID